MAAETLKPAADCNSPAPNLNEARDSILASLPGAENYLSDMTASPEQKDIGIDSMVDDLINELDAQNMMRAIENRFGKSEAEAQKFFKVPGRAPFKSRLDISENQKEKTQQMETVGQYLVLRYQSLAAKIKPTQHEKTELKQASIRLINFFTFSLENLFGPEDYDLKDLSNSINPEDRRRGEILPSVETLEAIQTISHKTANDQSIDAQNLYDEVIAATEGGHLIRVAQFLSNNKGSATVREVLQKLEERRLGDTEVDRAAIKLLWKTQQYRQAIGLDLETYNKLSGLPDTETTRKKTIGFLKNRKYVAETHMHLAKETGMTSKTQPLSYWDILTKRAEYLGLPDKALSPEEIQEKIDLVWSYLKTNCPFLFIQSPLTAVEVPTGPGADTRAWTLAYYNDSLQLVSAILLDPRKDTRSFLGDTVHENIHKLQGYLLALTGGPGIETLKDSEREPFAKTYENAVKTEFIADHNQSTSDGQSTTVGNDKPYGEFADLKTALNLRAQGTKALLQQELRIKMRQMMEAGRTGELSDDDAEALRLKYQAKLDEWTSLGIHLDVPTNIHSNLNMTLPTDGIMYLKEYIKKKKRRKIVSSQQTTPAQDTAQDSRLEEAFQKLFVDLGIRWPSDINAQLIFLHLLVSAPYFEDSSEYPNIIEAADPQEIKDNLKTIGFPIDEM